MIRGAIAGDDLDDVDPLVFLELGVEHKTPILIVAFGRDLIRLIPGQHEVGLSKLPAFSERGNGRQQGVVTSWRTGRNPPLNDVDLGTVETTIIGVFPNTGSRMPGRHPLLTHLLGDRSGPRPCILIRQKRHRGNLARPMTGDTVVHQDGCDVLRIRHVLGQSGRRDQSETYGGGQTGSRRRTDHHRSFFQVGHSRSSIAIIQSRQVQSPGDCTNCELLVDSLSFAAPLTWMSVTRVRLAGPPDRTPGGAA